MKAILKTYDRTIVPYRSYDNTIIGSMGSEDRCEFVAKDDKGRKITLIIESPLGCPILDLLPPELKDTFDLSISLVQIPKVLPKTFNFK